MLVLYLLCSLFGRFGVAFLGLTFNLDDSPVNIPPLSAPAWENGTLHRDDSIQEALDKELGRTTNRESMGQ